MELKRCPFCGGKAKACRTARNLVRVVCTQCYTDSYVYETEEEAIEHWNRRVNA